MPKNRWVPIFIPSGKFKNLDETAKDASGKGVGKGKNDEKKEKKRKDPKKQNPQADEEELPEPLANAADDEFADWVMEHIEARNKILIIGICNFCDSHPVIIWLHKLVIDLHVTFGILVLLRQIWDFNLFRHFLSI